MSERDFSIIDTAKKMARHPLSRLALAAGAIGGVSAGCVSEAAFKDGVVVEKRHEDENSWVQLIPIPQQICTSSGKSTSCITNYVFIPYTHYDDEDWVVKLEHCTTDPETSTKDCQSKDFYVKEEIYDGVKEGEYVDFGPNKKEVSLDDPIKKEKS